MSLLAKIFGFKTKEQQPEPVQSNKTIAELTPEALIDIIKSEQQEIETKTKAIQHLPYSVELTALLSSSQTQIQSAVAKRIAALLDQQTTSFDELKNNINDAQVLLNITSYCKNGDLITEQIQHITDKEQLTDLAVNGSTSKVRQAAATRVEDFDHLSNISRALKSKDKNVYKIVKEKLDKIKQQQKEHELRLQKLHTIVSSLEKLVSTIDTGSMAKRLKQIESQWQNESESADNNPYLDAYQTFFTQCQQRVNELEAEEQAKLEKERAVAAAQQAFFDIIIELKSYLSSLYSLEEISLDFANTSNEFIQASQKQWSEAKEHNKPSKEQSSQYVKLVDSIGALIINITQNGSIASQIQTSLNSETGTLTEQQLYDLLKPASLLNAAQIPECVKDAKKAIAEYENKIRKAQEEQDSRIKQSFGLTRKIKNIINDGNLRRASGMRKALAEKIELIDTLPARLEEQLEELDEGINKLQDYRNFATEPKKRELIAQMQQLADMAKAQVENPTDQFDPENHADQIQKLQSDWKELVYGGKDTQPELWEQFHELSQVAYAPSKEHFATKAEGRKQNLEHRRQVLKQLETYLAQYNWEKAVWKDVEQVLRTAKQEWTSYSPVDRAANTPVQKLFNKVINNIQGHIDTEYEKNKKAKASIVEAAQKLESTEDIEQAINHIKQLQAQWKNCGRTWQKEENTLWKQFRSQCDAVFDKKQQANNAFKEELEENKNKAETMCKNVEAFSQLTDKALLDKRTEINELTTQFNDISPLPRATEKALRGRFSSALADYDNAIVKQRKGEEAKAWQQIFTIKETLNQLANIVDTNGAESEQAIEKRAEIEASIADKPKWPAGTKTIIESQINHPAAPTDKTEKDLRLLCIQLETLVEVETPEEDKALRMEYQVARLQEGLTGGNTQPVNEQKEAIVKAWLASSPVAEVVYQSLAKRFSALI